MSSSDTHLERDPPNSTPTQGWLPQLPRQSWWLLGLGYLALVLLWVGGEPIQLALRYERTAIVDGQWWRLISGHLVHFDFRHLILNLAGATVMLLLFASALSRRQVLWTLAASVVVIDVGFLCLMPQLVWYVGLSGVLHGVLAAGCIAWWRVESKPMAIALTLVLVGKLLWEQLYGGLPLAGELPVVVEAHLFGAIGGGLVGAIYWFAPDVRSKSSSPNI